MVLAPISSVMKGAIQSLSPMVAFLLELCGAAGSSVFSARLFRTSFWGVLCGREPAVFTVPPAPVLNL